MKSFWVPLLVLLWAEACEMVNSEKRFICDASDQARLDQRLSSVHALVIRDITLASPLLKLHSPKKLHGIRCKLMKQTLENFMGARTNTVLEFLLQYYQADFFALPAVQRENMRYTMSSRGYENTSGFLDRIEKLSAVAKSKELIKGKTLIATSRDQKPSISFKMNEDTGKIYDISGDIFEILKLVGSSLDFSFKFVPSFEASAFINGSWTGTIGKLVRKPFFYEADKYSYIDYTTPQAAVSLTLVIPYPKETRSLLASTGPFTPTVWLCMLVTMTLIILTLTMAAYMRSTDSSILQAFLQSSMYTYGLITCQGLECPGRTHKSRLVAGIWGITGLLFIYSYNSQLTSFLTVPQMKPLVDTVEDLARSNELDIIMMPGSSILMQMLTATSGAYKIIGDRVRSNIQQHLAQNFEDGINKVASGRYAFAVNDYTATHYGHILFQKTRVCSIMMTKKPMSRLFSALTLPKGSPYLPAIDNKLLRITDAGIVLHLMKYSGNGLPRFQDHCKVPIKDFLTNVKLTLNQLLSAFAVLGIGLLAAFIAFLFELIVTTISS